MAVVATGSRHTQNTNYIIAVACILFACWFLYDGWFNQKFKEEHTKDGKPDLTLRMNKFYIPIGCAVVVAFFILSAQRLKSQKITADETGLEFAGGLKIAYDSIKQIDKRFFDKEGHFTLDYEQGGEVKKMKLTDRTYDGLGILLDEVVRQTGAAPPETESSDDEKDKTENA